MIKNISDGRGALCAAAVLFTKGELMPQKKSRVWVAVRIVIALVCAVGVVWSNLTRYMNVGNIAGIILFGGAGALALLWDGALGVLKRLWSHVGGRVLVLALAATVAAGASAAVFFSVNMARYGSQRTQSADCVIVLGCQVVGETPSYMLADRLGAALSLLERSPQAMCIVSGGQGARENITEAEAMRRWLTRRGIDGSRIIMEDRSVSTRDNFRGCAEIIAARGIDGNIAVVTNEYHQYRAELYARQAGLSVSHESARTSVRLILNSWLREWVGLLQYFITGGK